MRDLEKEKEIHFYFSLSLFFYVFIYLFIFLFLLLLFSLHRGPDSQFHSQSLVETEYEFLFVIFGPYHPSKQKKIGNLSIESQFSFLGHYAKVFSNS